MDINIYKKDIKYYSNSGYYDIVMGMGHEFSMNLLRDLIVLVSVGFYALFLYGTKKKKRICTNVVVICLWYPIMY